MLSGSHNRSGRSSPSGCAIGGTSLQQFLPHTLTLQHSLFEQAHIDTFVTSGAEGTTEREGVYGLVRGVKGPAQGPY